MAATKKNRRIKTALSIASCSLLNAVAFAEPAFQVNEVDNSILDDTEFQASNMLYAEDQRVIINESVLIAKKELSDEEFIKATFTADIMSGPSPNGLPAIKNPEQADTFTSPSGTIVTPRADQEQTFEFKDTRGAVNLEWQKPLSRLLKTTSGVSLSYEYDYMSLGISSAWSKDTQDRLTTFSTGLAFNYDMIKPVGGAPQPLTPTTNEVEEKYKDKSEIDLLLGVTQVLTRNTLLQINYVANYKTGYLTDPYKLVVFLKSVDLTPVDINPYYHEKRPDKRVSHIAYFNVLHSINEDVVKFSYRYFNDDWGVSSHTAETRYLKKLNDRTELQLKYRYYNQQSADFYHYHLVDGAAPGIESRDIVASPTDLKYASADYRLGDLRSDTVGIKLTRYFPDNDARLDFRVDRIINRDNNKRFETVRAWVVQLVGKMSF